MNRLTHAPAARRWHLDRLARTVETVQPGTSGEPAAETPVLPAAAGQPPATDEAKPGFLMTLLRALGAWHV